MTAKVEVRTVESEFAEEEYFGVIRYDRIPMLNECIKINNEPYQVYMVVFYELNNYTPDPICAEILVMKA